MPNNLDRARNAVRFVKWSCPIGAATNELDIEKTKSLELSAPWSRTSVVFLRNASKEFFKALDSEVDACGIAASEWVEQMTKLKPKPEPNISNGTNLATLMNDLKQVLNEEFKFGKTLCEESIKLYNEHHIMLYIIHKIAELAYEAKCGNCAEQSALAFVYLLKLNVAPIELFQVENGDHLFIVLGRSKNSDPRNLMTWGDAVICDPFANTCFTANKITAQQLKELLGEKPNACPKLYLRQENAIYVDSKNQKSDTPTIALSLRDVYKNLIDLTISMKFPNSQVYISQLCARVALEDKSKTIFRLKAYNRIDDIQAKACDDELRKSANQSIAEMNKFFTNAIKPPILNQALQQEIKTFKFKKK